MAAPARLIRTLQVALGNEAADDLVTWMHAMETSRSELRDFNELNFSRFDSRVGEQRHWMQGELGAVRSEMQAEFAAVRSEMQAEFAAVRSEMHGGFAAVRAEMQQGLDEQRKATARLEALIERRFADLLKWSFGFWVATAIGLAALMR